MTVDAMRERLTYGILGGIGWVLSTIGSASEPASATGLLTGSFPVTKPWDIPTMYHNPADPWVQDFAIVGQVQTQYAYGFGAKDDYGSADLPKSLRWENVEVRRLRLGAKGKLFENLSFLNLMDLQADYEPRLYKRTPETYLTWTQSDALQISAGKTELKFDREQEYSSKEFPLFERTALGNMFYGGELTGAWVNGKGLGSGWLYFFGVYSNDREDEWTRFDGGTVWLGKIGYNYSRWIGLDQAEVKLQLLHNTQPGFAPSPSHLASPLYSNCISLANEMVDGPYGLTVEALWGDGSKGRADTYGLSAMPFWNLTEKLQWISDFEVAASPQENGVLLPYRYEALAPGVADKSGDGYVSAYSGFNYFIHGHNLKLMSGIKYSHLTGGTGGGDFSGWCWLTGMRLAF